MSRWPSEAGSFPRFLGVPTPHHVRTHVTGGGLEKRGKLPGHGARPFLAHAFRGAERAAEIGTVRTTLAHEAVMSKWKAAANPVLQFLLDAEWVELDHAAVVVRTREAYATYRKWASEVGMRNPFGRNHFLELIDSTGASIGVGRRKPHGGQEFVGGLRLIERGLNE